MGIHEEYQQKLVTAEDAVRVVQPGDWIDYGFCVNHPVDLDKALAKRMANDPALTDLKFRGAVAMCPPEVTRLPDSADRVTWNSWHSSCLERKLCDAGIGFYSPIRFSEMP